MGTAKKNKIFKLKQHESLSENHGKIRCFSSFISDLHHYHHPASCDEDDNGDVVLAQADAA